LPPPLKPEAFLINLIDYYERRLIFVLTRALFVSGGERLMRLSAAQVLRLCLRLALYLFFLSTSDVAVFFHIAQA
jgi:hypothetical protein